MTAEELIVLNEEIAGMAQAGLPLDQGLAALAREMGGGRLQKLTSHLAADLKEGRTLDEALARQGSRVPPFYAGLVAAGVRSGRIGEVLATLTVYARTLADLRSLVLGALFYPAVVLILALVLFAFVCSVLIPHFAQIYADFRMQLPTVTEWVIVIGRHPVYYLVTPPLILAAMIVATRLVLLRFERGRIAWARWVYVLPIAGTLVRSSRLAAFADLLAILVDHKVPLPEAMRLAGQASSDPLMAAGCQAMQPELAEGRSLADVLRGSRLVPELITWMVGLGERRGTLGQTLRAIAAMYRRQVELRANLLRTVLPPMLVLLVATLTVGVFAVVIGVPLVALIQGLSGQKL